MDAVSGKQRRVDERTTGPALRIGVVVRRTGLTQRTLRFYESEGLIDAPRRSPAGYRLYDARVLAQIHQVMALRALGWPLARIVSSRDRSVDLRALLAEQIAGLQHSVQAQQKLIHRLSQMHAALANAPATTETLLQLIEVTQMYEKFYTQTQLDALQARATALGAPALEAAQQEWPQLIGAMQSHRSAGTPASHPDVRALAQRWQALVQAFTGGDAAITASLARTYETPAVQQHTGIDPELMAYVRAALAPV